MRIALLVCICFLICFTYASGKDSGMADPVNTSDSAIRQIFSDYQNALSLHDLSFPKRTFISDPEYHQLLEYVQQKQPNCIGTDEAAFSAEMNSKVFRDMISSKIIINKISVNRIEYNYSCGNLLEIPRVICTIRYSGKKTVEVPFLMVKTISNEYKILRNFLNYNLFSYE